MFRELHHLLSSQAVISRPDFHAPQYVSKKDFQIVSACRVRITKPPQVEFVGVRNPGLIQATQPSHLLNSI